ncbi:MAG TPA: hypothetical protein VFK06_16240 [Candidatus Angelobacter sp.]|nr:hypothetical protein [Candidatus Angelobacter sp.]
MAAALVLSASAQQLPDPGVVLRQTARRLLADLDRMPRYTCIQTVTRTYYDSKAVFHTPACSVLIAEHNKPKHKLPVQGWDRLRLEVALVDRQSVYSWVGASRFSDETLDKLGGNGPIGSGDFGVFLSEILERAALTFQREQVIEGQRLLEYSYDMPIESSTYRVKTSEGWVRTGYSGSLLLDPKAIDIVKLTVRTAELPKESDACSEVTYGRASIHDRMVLVPRETQLSAINTSGDESLSQTTFAKCREYSSTVRLMFNDAAASDGSSSATAASSSAAPLTELPAGLHFDARIVTPIDSDTAAVGDPVEAVLRSPLRGKNKSVIAPAGARLHGRLRTMRWSELGRYFQIAVQLESVEIAGRNVPLAAEVYPPPSRAVILNNGQYRTEQLKPDESFIGGSFFFQSEHLRLKQLDSEWVTVSADTKKNKENK